MKEHGEGDLIITTVFHIQSEKTFCCKVVKSSLHTRPTRGSCFPHPMGQHKPHTMSIKTQTLDSQSSWIGLCFYQSASSPPAVETLCWSTPAVETLCWSTPAGLQEASAVGTALLSGPPGAPCRTAHGLNA